MNKKKILNDPVYGFISIPSELVFDIIEHRYFQRLRRIKQMGLTHYVYPGALHTRLHHALGAMHLMQLAINVLRSKDVEITKDEAEGATIAILLHDIGHGPFSHTLEGLLLDCHHETLTKLYMHTLNEEFDGALDMAIAIFEGTYPKAFLHQLITGQLDLDRMDYLKRDSFFSGVAEGVIGYDRIIKMLDVRDGQIVVEQKGRFSIEQFLMARRLMYWQVYLHKTGLAAERMMRRVMELIRKHFQDGGEIDGFPDRLREFMITHRDPATGDTRSILEDFAKLDDVDVLSGLKAASESPHRLLAYLANGILMRRLFHTQFMDSRPGKGYKAKLTRMAMAELQFEANDAEQLIIEGYESIPTYRTGVEEILILTKAGIVVPLSHILEMRSDAVNDAHFLVYPKAIRQE